jgi:glycosyltransferase involved in cell wall biosynthesis
MHRPYISIVFATLNRLKHLQKTMLSIKRELDGKFPYEIVIVDGGSTDGSGEYLKNCDHVRMVVETEKKGCCFAYDNAFRMARGKWVCWLNDDIEVLPGAFEKMAKFMEAPENSNIGMGVFPASRSRDALGEFVVNSCMKIPIPYADFGFLRRHLLKKIGYLDLAFYKYGWDPDLALRIWDQGLKVMPCPQAHIIHYFVEDELRAKDEPQRIPDSEYLGKKWKKRVEQMAKNIYDEEGYFDKIENYLSAYDRLKILSFLGRFEKVEPIALDYLKQNPEDFEWLNVYYQTGLGLHRKGHLDGAKRVYSVVMTYHDRFPELAAWANFKFAEVLLSEDMPQEAAELFRKAIELKPDHAKAKILLLDKNESLNVTCAGEKSEDPCQICVDLDLTDSMLWDYYFGSRKIDRLEIIDGVEVLRGEYHDFATNVYSYLNTRGKLCIQLGGENLNEQDMRRLKMELSNTGLAMSNWHSGVIAGLKPA